MQLCQVHVFFSPHLGICEFKFGYMTGRVRLLDSNVVTDDFLGDEVASHNDEDDIFIDMDM